MKNNLEDGNSNQSDNIDSILVWLDFGPYAYFNFGIINELSKLEKFDFIGIITTKQDVDFFQKQKIINFKEILYYPECYIGKRDFNISDLRKTEDEFELNLWKDIFSERSFYKFWTYFHKFSREEILAIVGNSIKFFNEILKKYHPKIIIMQQPGENISNLLLYKIAQKKGIEVIMPNNLHYKNRIHISNNLTSKEISEEFLESLPNNVFEEDIVEEFLEKRDNFETLKIVASFDSGMQTLSQKINHYLRRFSNDLEPIYKNVGKSKTKLFKQRIENYFEFRKREKFLEKNTIKRIEDKKYLYFPLQSEPESTILAISPFFSNQIALIETIAKAIPIDSTLYVKEHPFQKEKLWRSVRDYKKIINIPNVKFIHPNVRSLDILKNSQSVIAISGSTGFEALFYKKPVILFGDEHYDCVSTVTKVQNINDLPKLIRNAIKNFKFDQMELNRFMKILNENSLSVPYASILKDGVSLSSIQRNERSFDLTNSNFQKFIEKYDSEFKLIAKTILSRYEKISQ